MRLESFRVTNFRSITDSGLVEVARITALLGRNESGKTNLLRGLHSLNPAEGFNALNPIKDFPRHRRLEECTDNTDVVSSTWELSDSEQTALLEFLPRASAVTRVRVGRSFGAKRWVEFVDLGTQELDQADVRTKVRKIVPAVKAAADKLGIAVKASLDEAADAFEADMSVNADGTLWAEGAGAALKQLRKALAAADAELTEKQEQLVVDLEQVASSIANEKSAIVKARTWVLETLPSFMFLDEYPELRGHQNIDEYLERKTKGAQTDADRSFEKLCKVAGLEPSKLHALLVKGDQETRNQLANRAGAVVTSEIKRLWKDRPLKIRFNLDANHLDTLISDPNSTYDVEVNLDERSRGFQWFFAFYITFSADTNGGTPICQRELRQRRTEI